MEKTILNNNNNKKKSPLRPPITSFGFLQAYKRSER